MARVLGVDPGFASFGWCVMDLRRDGETLLSVGVIRTQKDNRAQHVLATDDNMVRARQIYAELSGLCETYGIRAIAAEAMSFPRSSSVAAKMAMSWGVLAALSESRDLPVVHASPQTVKKLVAGDRSASKEDVASAVCAKFPGSPLDGFYADTPKGQQEHGFDAIAVLLACMGSEVLRMARG